jgi:hypothetical protein
LNAATAIRDGIVRSSATALQSATSPFIPLFKHEERYYETLEESSRGWHEGDHDPWPYINYLLFILKQAYRQFEERLGETTSPRGAKRATVNRAIERFHSEFTVTDLQRECPGVSLDMIRHVLKELREQGAIESLGRGRSARWRRKLGNNSE